MYNSSSVAKLFAGFSNIYDLSLYILTFGLDYLWKRRLLSRVGQAKGIKVLDVAAGTGILTKQLTNLVGKQGLVIGVDLSKPMLMQAKRKLEKSENNLLQSLAEHLPFIEHSFDRISACYLQKYCSQEMFLSEVKRLLKPTGRAVLYDFAEPIGAKGLVQRLYISRVLKLLAVFIKPIHFGLSRVLDFLPGKIASSKWYEEITCIAPKCRLRILEVTRLPSGAAVIVTLAPIR